MTDISIRGFDGDAGGPIDGRGERDRVAAPPDFSGMTLEQIQAWETAHNTNPLTGAFPASAVVGPHGEPLVPEPSVNEVASLALAPPLQEAAYTPEAQEEIVAEQELIRAEFSLGEPFVHVVAYLTAGPVEIIATPVEALELYNKLGLALGAAQRAGVLA